MTYPDGICSYGSFGYDLSFQSSYEVWGSKASLFVERAFNIKKNIPAKIQFNDGTGIKKIQIPPNDQFKTMIETFCKETTKTNSQHVFENNLLVQSYVMDCARKSFEKKQTISLKPITQF